MCAARVLARVALPTARLAGPENFGGERMLVGLPTLAAVNGPTRITLEYNGKIRPQPDRENGFSRACGGGNATDVEPSPLPKLLE